MAFGPAGFFCAFGAYVVGTLAETRRLSDMVAQQFLDLPQTKEHHDLMENSKRRLDLRNSSTAASMLLGGAVILSAAGMLRGSSPYQHAHHLTGLLFGSAYGHAKYTSNAIFKNANTTAAGMD